MKIPDFNTLKLAMTAAAIGATSGIVYSIVDSTTWAPAPREFVTSSIVFGLLGGFLGWWAWLFWKAVKASFPLRCVALPGILAVALLIFVLERPNLSLAERFRKDGIAAQGVVTGIFASDHNHIGYTYSVGRLEYHGRDFAPGLATDWKVGDPIRIHYLRSDPSVSVSRYPADTLWSVVTASLFGGFWLVSGVVNLHAYVWRTKVVRPKWLPFRRTRGHA